MKAAAPMGLGYLHVLRPLYPGTFAVGGGFDLASGNAALASGLADFVVFGKPFTSNPDLAERFAAGLSLTPFDTTTFYTPGPKGYTDFPSLTVEAGL